VASLTINHEDSFHADLVLTSTIGTARVGDIESKKPRTPAGRINLVRKSIMKLILSVMKLIHAQTF
jgi:hypothetical protein